MADNTDLFIWRFSRSKRRLIPVVITVVILFVFGGLYFIARGNAETYVVDRKIQSVTLAGNATFQTVAGSASSQVVRFGTPATTPTPTPTPPTPTPTPTPPTPTPEPLVLPTSLKAYVGGDSIALTWYPAETSGVGFAVSYNVYRNGVKIATTVADSNESGRQYGSQYIDRNVVRGQNYSYQVQGIIGARQSALTAAVSAVHPQNSTPVPNVVLDSSVTQLPSTDANWFRDYAVPIVKTWYPKVSHVLAYPDYVVAPTITIKTVTQAEFDKVLPNASAYVVGNTIIVNPKYIVQYKSFLGGIMVHEATHILQHAATTDKLPVDVPRWLVEGVAEYAHLSIYNGSNLSDTTKQPQLANDHYTDHYLPSTKYLVWLQKQYEPGYMRRSTIAGHKATFNPTFTAFGDGRNYDEAWGLMRGVSTRTGTFRHNAGGRCLDDSGALMTPGNPMILWLCNGNLAQKITYRPIPSSANAQMIVLGHCVTAGNQNNQIVWIEYCNKTLPSQQWVKRSDGTIASILSGRCLAPFNGKTTEGAEMVVVDCNGSAHQRWTTP